MINTKTDTEIDEVSNDSQNIENEIDRLQVDIELHANKLFLLIQNSTMPDETKESFIEMLPFFSLEQLERLTGILEAKYLDEKTQNINQQFKEEIENTIAQFKTADSKDGEAFLNQINVISKGL